MNINPAVAIATAAPDPERGGHFCLQCGRPTKERRRQFCSRACAADSMRQVVDGTRIWTCKTCGCGIQPKPGQKPSRLFRRSFCSDACRSLATKRLHIPATQRSAGLWIDSAGVDSRGLAITARLLTVGSDGAIIEEQILELDLDFLRKSGLLNKARKAPYQPWSNHEEE